MMSMIDALTGNECVAEAVRLCRPDIIAAYPITPQSVVVELLASMVADGKLGSKVVDVESEHSSMSVVKGAAMLGKRVFTATAGQGLAYMYEPYFSMSTMRFPMVMTLACREMISPGTVWCGLQDALSVRDAGWMQVFCENNQEILDMVIQGYRIAEDHGVLIPINVCYDGFYLSHQTERVELPEPSEVDAYLPPIDLPQYLDVNEPAIVDPNTVGSFLIRYREDHLACMQHAKSVIADANREFAARFGSLVKHIHMKDIDRDGKLCLPGDGVIDPHTLGSLLDNIGYGGCVSLEWEKRWQPELAEPDEAFSRYVEWMPLSSPFNLD